MFSLASFLLSLSLYIYIYISAAVELFFAVVALITNYLRWSRQIRRGNRQKVQ